MEDFIKKHWLALVVVGIAAWAVYTLVRTAIAAGESVLSGLTSAITAPFTAIGNFFGSIFGGPPAYVNDPSLTPAQNAAVGAAVAAQNAAGGPATVTTFYNDTVANNFGLGTSTAPVDTLSQ